MQVLYSIISVLIMLLAIDGVYFSYKKYIEYINKKNNSSISSMIPMKYPALFLLGGIINVAFYNKADMFLEILKGCFLFGFLFVLAYVNIIVFKRMIFRTKGNIQSFKSFDKNSVKTLFKKKK